MRKHILLRAAALVGTVSLLGSTLMSVSAEEPTLGSTCSYRFDQIRTTTKDGSDERRKAMTDFLQVCPGYLQGTLRGTASTSTISAAGTTATETVDCTNFYRRAVELKQQNPRSPELKNLEEQYQKNCTGAPAPATLSCEQYQRMLKQLTDTLARTSDRGRKEGLVKRQEELTAKIASCTPASSPVPTVTTEGTTQCHFTKLANGCVIVTCADLNVTLNSCPNDTSISSASTSDDTSTSSSSSSTASSDESSSASSSSSAAVEVSSASRSSLEPKTDFTNYRGIPIRKPVRVRHD